MRKRMPKLSVVMSVFDGERFLSNAVESILNQTFEDFNKIVGFNYLKGMHLNDSKKELASRVDRHDSIGIGFLGEEVFVRIMNDSRFDGIPIILETPDRDIWKKEIKWLYSVQK